MVISDTSYMINGFTIALLVAEFGQVWAEHVRREVRPQLRSSVKSLRLCSPRGYKISYAFG